MARCGIILGKEIFDKQVGLFEASVQDLAVVSHCYFCTNETRTVTALTNKKGRLSKVRELVTPCIAYNEDPASMIQEFKRKEDPAIMIEQFKGKRV